MDKKHEEMDKYKKNLHQFEAVAYIVFHCLEHRNFASNLMTRIALYFVTWACFRSSRPASHLCILVMDDATGNMLCTA
jgi:hypothetical protein